MGQVHCDVDGLADLLAEVRRVERGLTDERFRLWGAFLTLRSEWKDAHARQFQSELDATLSGVLRALAELEAARLRAESWVPILRGYLGSARTRRTGGAGVATPPTAAAASGPAVSSGSMDTGRRVRGRGCELEVWSFAGVAADRIDWGADPDFPAGFDRHAHHGNPDAGIYREMVAAVPRVLAAAGGYAPGTFAQGSIEQKSHDAMLGDPVTLDVTSDGRVHVTDGRHRLMAAIEAGCELPVRVRRC